MAIPVQNIYYLLSYAWDQFAPRQVEKIASEPFPDSLHLFATILVTGIRALHQRGFETGYITVDAPTSSLRGRLLVSETIRLVAAQPARVHCAYDEMTQDILTNQILRATLDRILAAEGLERTLRARVRQTRRLFDQVSGIELTPRVFQQVRLHQNNRMYAFLINVCRFLYESLQPLDQAGAFRFQDVMREPERMRRIFERFVRNFYRRNQRTYTVGKEQMKWSGRAVGDSDFTMVPQMETDVTLRCPDRVIVIECKYTESMHDRGYFAGKFRSPHLYQLAAYLRNLGDSTEGILLYPTIDTAIDQTYVLQDHRLRIATLDLNRNWQAISDSMLALVGIDT
jgi:5-methylcytosine-specific restriction enzyme subunit McrC